MAELNFPNAVREEGDFYGRQTELRQIEAILRGGRSVPVVILGERRIGKTSLQNVVLQRLVGSDGERFLALQIEPRGLVSLEDLTQAILQRLSSKMSDFRATSEPIILPPTPVGQFDQVFRHLAEPAPSEVFLLCIDEFDEIVRSARPDELPRIMGLIHHLMEHADLPLRLFFTMTRIPSQLEIEQYSPLVSKSTPIELSPLPVEDLEALVKGVSHSSLWTLSGIECLYELSGGHPYIAKLLLLHVLGIASQSEPPPTVEREQVEFALSAALEDPHANHVLSNLYRVHFNDNEKALLLTVSRRGSLVTEKELKLAGAAWSKAARYLENRHYLQKISAGVDYRINFLGKWLRSWIEFEEECERFSALLGQLQTPVEIQIDRLHNKVSVLGNPVRLSPQEMRIMICLAEHSEQVVDREILVEAVWNTIHGVSDQTVDTAFYRLRAKLNDQGQYIQTIPGRGFILHRAILMNKG